MLTMGSLFSGIGGWEFAARARARATPLWGVELDPVVARYYELNHGNHVHVADLRMLDVSTLAPVDILVASPPCPDFSVSLKSTAKPRDPSIALLGLEVLRYVDATTPSYVAVENAPAYMDSVPGCAIIQGLRDRGFTVMAEVLNAADYGCPQRRRRTIIRATKRAELVLPAQQSMSWWGALSSEAESLEASQLAPWQESNFVHVPPPSYPVFISGGNPPVWRNASGFRRVWTLAQDPAPTISRSKDSSGSKVVLKEGDIRKLDIPSFARLSGFDPSLYELKLPEGKTAALNMLGNCIPPPLAAAALHAAWE